MSNRAPHRDYQAAYSTALRLPLNRTLSDQLISALTDPTAPDVTDDIGVALTTRRTSGPVAVALCGSCDAVFAYLPTAGDDPSEWMRQHAAGAHRGVRVQ